MAELAVRGKPQEKWLFGLDFGDNDTDILVQIACASHNADLHSTL